jgi:type II secretory pathway component PulK
MKIVPSSQPRGIALIIVMLVIVTLAILAGGFAYSMKVETTLARNSSMDSELEWMGRSGIELAKYVLSQSGPGGMQVDALNQKWAGGTGDTNSPVADLPLDNYQLGRGSIAVKIVDLDRKFNINTLTPANTEILRQALILMGVDAAETPKIVNAILSWMNTGFDSGMGAKDVDSSYYRSLEPPYRSKNGPIDDITELMLIHWITPAMFYGSGQSGQSMRSMPHHGLGPSALDEPVYPIGFVDLFTTLSAGTININTASAEVLQLVPEVDENLAQAIISARAGPNDPPEGTEGRMPFRSIQELQRVPGMPPGLVQQFARYFGVRSSTFEAQIEARIGNYKRNYVALLRRDGNRMSTLYMYWQESNGR